MPERPLWPPISKLQIAPRRAMLIAMDCSSLPFRSERISPDMATLLVIEDVPTLAQPTRDECGAVHNRTQSRPARWPGGLMGWGVSDGNLVSRAWREGDAAPSRFSY